MAKRALPPSDAGVFLQPCRELINEGDGRAECRATRERATEYTGRVVPASSMRSCSFSRPWRRPPPTGIPFQTVNATRDNQDVRDLVASGSRTGTQTVIPDWSQFATEQDMAELKSEFKAA